MNPTAIVHVLFLLTVANGTPVLAKWLMGDRFAFPIDFGTRFPDGRPLLGRSKTIRGVALSLALTAGAARATGLGWANGALIALASMAGDLLSSFLKRRLGLPPSAMALGLDQIPESLLPALVASRAAPLSPADVVAVVTLFFAGELVVSRLLYALRIREQPY